MTPQQVRSFALSLPEATEDHPFGIETDVYRIEGLIFALLKADAEKPFISLKCEPRLAIILRQQFPAVTPGWHLNKKHWNSIALDGTVPPEDLQEMIQHSYEQVLKKLPKATRLKLAKEGE